MFEWLFVPVGYLLGSISTGVLVSRAFGLPDPREGGSKNPGATNVLRLGGKKAAIATLLGDALKGTLAVLLARWAGAADMVIAATGVAAFVGHLYPVFFGFKGGKGVATGLGVLLGFSGWIGLSVAATWIAVAFITKYSSLAALVAALLAPAYVWLFGQSLPIGIACLVMAGLVFYRHQANIGRLLKGEESRIGQKG